MAPLARDSWNTPRLVTRMGKPSRRRSPSVTSTGPLEAGFAELLSFLRASAVKVKARLSVAFHNRIRAFCRVQTLTFRPTTSCQYEIYIWHARDLDCRAESFGSAPFHQLVDSRRLVIKKPLMYAPIVLLAHDACGCKRPRRPPAHPLATTCFAD